MSVDGLGRVRKTHCKHGHKFSNEAPWKVNWKGYKCRVCHECDRLRMARKRLNPEYKARGAAATAKWREANPERYEAKWRADQEARRQLLLDARAGGCVKCGLKHPACLDFHHRNPAEKEGHIGEFRKFGKKRLLAEIAKCDVLCANCHRIFHYDQRQTKSAPEAATL